MSFLGRDRDKDSKRFDHGRPETPSQDKALVVTREVDGHPFGQRASDGYFDATAMCQAAGKRFNNYFRSAKTQDTLKALASETRKAFRN